MKKLINAPVEVTSDMLAGIAAADRRFVVDFDHGVVLRADYVAHRDSGRVALISGGGSGHEPAHAGYVGQGMLTAAVAGEVFTSPSVDAVLAAIRLVTGAAGCLLIVKNYTGDRLNFGLAASIARSEGLSVGMVLVDDDVAIAAGKSRAGARGLAGTILVHKIAGAAAEAGVPLATLERELQTLIAGVGTMGVGLSACTVPAAGTPSFMLGDDEIEYGLGIHGEAGASREPIVAADEIARRLIDTIIDRKQITSGTQVVLLVNGLGGTPPAELALVAGSALAVCRDRGVVVARVLVGSFLTALEMAGCSMSLARVSDEHVARLDAPCEAPAWIAPSIPAEHVTSVAAPKGPTAAAECLGAKISDEHQSYLRAGIVRIGQALISAEPHLTELDSSVGDGDLGISLARGARTVLDALDTFDCAHPARALEQIAQVLRRSVGGTSGPLYAAFTLAVAVDLRSCTSSPTLADWAHAFACGCRAVSVLGGAGHGDRTMLDALLPASDALTRSAAAGVGQEQALREAVDAASAGTAETARLDPRFGRSSYVGDRAIGHVDPGAEAVTIWLQAARA